MTDLLDRLLRSFEVYYNVKREGIAEPFAAEARFHSHDEQYFLVKSARISEAESNEYVYFADLEQLDKTALLQLDEAAWSRGLEHVQPHKDHRSSDVVLIILAQHITKEALEDIPKLQHYKSYRLGLQGWSHYRLIALETSSGRTACNRQGQSLKKLISNIKQ